MLSFSNPGSSAAANRHPQTDAYLLPKSPAEWDVHDQ